MKATKAGFDGSFDMHLPKRFEIRLKRAGVKFFSQIDKAESNQLLWNTAIKTLFFLNKDRELFELNFKRVKEAK
jgi:hypothetical protein